MQMRGRSFLLNQCQNRSRRGPIVTVIVLALVIATLLLAYLVFGKNTQPKSTLRLVSILFRHGDRTPTETYKTDPHKSVENWPDGWGALTKKGKLEMFGLGEYLRRRYDHFLSGIYSPLSLLVKSSDNDRCLMSADTLLAGLYPPLDSQVWNPDILWQPIPVHATPRALDKLIVVKKPCPVYDGELKKAYASTEIQKINSDNYDLYQHLSNHTGQLINDITSLEFLFNTLYIEDLYNLTLPEWTKGSYPQPMQDIAAQSLAIFTHTDVMKRLKGGPLVKEIILHMTAKDQGDLIPDRRMFLYSVHDLTLVSVLRTLGFDHLLKPDYGATLLLELHTTLSGIGHEVQLFYMKSSSSDPMLLNIPKCGYPCFLETFISLTKPYLPLDWEAECITQ